MKKSTRLRADVAKCCCRGEEEKKEGGGQKKRQRQQLLSHQTIEEKKSQLKAEGRRWGELAGNGTY